MTAASFSFVGTDRLRSALREAGPLATQALASAMVAEMHQVIAMATPLVPANTGNLRGSGVVLPPVITGTRIEVEAGFGNSASNYAIFVHEGRRPGAKAPPVDAIKQWLHDKGADEKMAFVVARAIARRGIPKNGKPSKFLERAFVARVPGMGDRLGAEVEKAFARLSA